MLTVIDLFCGAGGFSKGFQECGFKVLLGVDNEVHKLKTYSKNIKPEYYLNNRQYLLNNTLRSDSDESKIVIDIKEQNDLVKLTKKKISKAIGNEKVDVLIGSPPCKDYSKCNEKKDINSDRANLYNEFIRMVRLFKPEWLVLENVVEFFETKHGELLENTFSILGYNTKLFIIKSEEFGIPQGRKRGFIIGSLSYNNFDLERYKKDRITIKDAISDLETEENIDELYKYKVEPQSDYQILLRKDMVEVRNHITTKHKKRTVEKIKTIKTTEKIKGIKTIGNQYGRGYYTVKNYNKVSGVITSEFNNPSAKGESIHPKLDRTFTAREAARIQSFPDDFVFYGTIDEIAVQIGDAVPPLVAQAIASMIKDKMNNI